MIEWMSDIAAVMEEGMDGVIAGEERWVHYFSSILHPPPLLHQRRDSRIGWLLLAVFFQMLYLTKEKRYGRSDSRFEHSSSGQLSEWREERWMGDAKKMRRGCKRAGCDGRGSDGERCNSEGGEGNSDAAEKEMSVAVLPNTNADECCVASPFFTATRTHTAHTTERAESREQGSEG